MEKTILLVDDVKMFLEIQKEFLQNSSVKIVTAANGVEALQAIVDKKPDLIFMDFEMPEMNGADCCRAIKSNPQSATIPVVMITGRGDEASKGQCLSAGCDDFLTKPLNRNLYLETAGKFVIDIDRRDTRKAINLPGSFRSRGASFPCILSNISMGGAFISADYIGDVDRVVQISFTLPDGTALECQGKIIWSNDNSCSGSPGFGVNFLLLPKEAKDALAAFFSGSGCGAR